MQNCQTHSLEPVDAKGDRNENVPSGPGTYSRQAVIVLGMHRSGTSALAGMLARLGVRLPRTLLEPNSANPKGYQESRKLMEFHDRLLASAGSHWTDWARFNTNWKQSSEAVEFAEELKELIWSEYGDSNIFLVKDPRMCRILPFWFEQLDALNVDPRVAISVRNPLEVAQSLKTRNGLSVSTSLLLWLRHMLDAEAETRTLTRSFVTYRDLLLDWRCIAERLACELDIRWPEPSGKVEKEIDEYLSKDLYRQKASDDQIAVSTEVSTWVEEAYTSFKGLIGNGGNPGELKRIDEVRDRFNEATAIFAKSFYETWERFRGEVNDRDMKIENLRNQLEQERTRGKELNVELSAWKRKEDQSSKKLVAERDRRCALEGMVTDQDEKIRTLSSALESERGRSRSLESMVSERDENIGTLSSTLESERARIRSLEGTVSDRNEKIGTLSNTLESERSRSRSIEGTLRGRDEKINSLSKTLETKKARYSELASEYKALQRHYTAIKQSTSWRLTAPMRTLSSAGKAVSNGIGSTVRKAAGDVISAWRHVVRINGVKSGSAATSKRQEMERYSREGVLECADNDKERSRDKRQNEKEAQQRVEESLRAGNLRDAVSEWPVLVDAATKELPDEAEQLIVNALFAMIERGDGREARDLAEEIANQTRRTKWLLNVMGVAALRISSFADAERIWMEYWSRAKQDRLFKEKLPAPRSQSSGNRNEQKFAELAQPQREIEYQAPEDRLCIYTALFGNYDSIQEPLVKPPGVDFICFSDRPRNTRKWEVRVVDPMMESNVLNNRIIKMLPHVYLPEYVHSLYVDSNVQWLGDPLLLYYHWLRNNKFVAWRHPERADVFVECEEIMGRLRWRPDAIINEYEYLQSERIPKDVGLIEASFLWRKHDDPNVKSLMERWWDHVREFRGRDQPALALNMWRTGVRPFVLPKSLGDSRRNQYFEKRAHLITPLEADSRKHEDQHQTCDRKRTCDAARDRQVGHRARGRRRLVWIYRERAVQTATLMRGNQLYDMVLNAKERSFDVDYVDEHGAVKETNAILILTRSFLRDAERGELERLKENGNTVCVDNVDHKANPDFHDFVDVYIAASIMQYRHYVRSFPDKLVQMITHNVDPGIAGAYSQDKFCNVGYFGEIVNAAYKNELAGYVDFVQTNNMTYTDRRWISKLPQCNVHYSVRRHRDADDFKPFTKGFTAAHCGANIIVSRDESDARYYLGCEYPYILADDSLDSVTAMLEHVARTFKGPEWKHGLEIMESVRCRSSFETITTEIAELVERV